MLVQLPHHHRFDQREDFRDRRGIDPERRRHAQRRAEIPAGNRAGWRQAQLPAKAADQIPDLNTFIGLRPVQDLRAGFAGADTGVTISIAPAEDPLGKGDETFFS